MRDEAEDGADLQDRVEEPIEDRKANRLGVNTETKLDHELIRRTSNIVAMVGKVPNGR